MASENRPGVIVTQALTETSAVTASPSLVPLVLAPCFQIIEAVASDGTLNSTAKHSIRYSQSAMTITQAEFPDPRDNIDEIDIYEDEVSVHLYKFSALEQLQRGSNGTTGSAFLSRIAGIYRAAVSFNMPAFTTTTFSSEKRLVMALDAANPSDLTKDKVYKFDSTVTTLADVAAVFNDTYGQTIAKVVGNAVVVYSTSYGPASSITLRGGSSAIQSNNLLTSEIASPAVDNRVEGSGLFAQDDEDGDLKSVFIAYSRGVASASNAVNGGTFSSLSAWPAWAGYVGNDDSSTYAAAMASAVKFGGSSPTIPLKAATTTTPGDYLVVNGSRPDNNEVILVEETRFKLGSLNASKSTANSSGGYSTRIYDTLKFDLTTGPIPFSPQYAYLVAQNLVYGDITPEGTAASAVSQTTNVLAARPAMVSAEFDNTASGFNSANASLTGLTLLIQETVDGVQQETVTVTWAGTLSISEVAAAINGGDVSGKCTKTGTLTCVGSVEGSFLVISSGKDGADQSVIVKTGGSANTILGFSTSSATSATGVDLSVAEQAFIVGDAIADTAVLTGADNIQLEITDSFGTHTINSTTAAASSGYSDMDELAVAIATAFGGGSADLFVYSDGIKVASISVSNGSTSAGAITFTTIEGGASVQLSMLVDVDSLGFDGNNDLGNGAVDLDDDGADLLKGSSLKISLDGNPEQFDIRFDSNSLNVASDLINETIGGDVDISSLSSTGVVTFTSSSVGVSSEVSIANSGSAVASILNISSLNAVGAGRPNPDFYIDSSTLSVILGPNQLRNNATGVPYNASTTTADVYIEYKALRKDVTASASSPGIVTFGSITELEASIGPISTENPLGLAAYLCMLNSSTSTISCLGIDETTDSAPLGTVDGYLRALELLESKEVYSITPMTDDIFIQQVVSTHVQTLSQPTERGERIALMWKGTPDRAEDTSIEGASGEATQTGADNVIRLEDNPTSAVISAGITDVSSISVDDGLYLEVTTVALGSTQVHNYSVSEISSANGMDSSIRTSFSSGENDDGFYSTTTFSGTASFSSIRYSMRIRGSKLLIKGTTLPDVGQITATAAAQAATFAHRRVFLLFGDSADVSIGGAVTNVPGYYIAAGIAGMIGSQAPQQPFTNLIMSGYSKVYGTDDTYSENQLDVIADGGRYILKNLGGGITARHQRSTSNLTIESRELSITKAIDFLAKGLRQINRVFIGKFVITPGFLDQLTMANEGYLRRVVQQGVVRTSNLTSLLQSETAPDTVLIEVEVQPAYPCNKIRITIVS